MSETRSGANGAAVDMRQTEVYAEAEALFRTVYKPGSGRVAGAADPCVARQPLDDGSAIAFTGVLLEKLEGVPTTRVCLLERDASRLRVATFGPNTDCSPRFSPDGRTLAFRSDRSRPGDFQLHFLDLVAGETRPAPVVAGWVEYFEFSPDGTRILLGVAGHGADVAGAQGAKTSEQALGDRPAWMPAVETGDEEFRRRSAWVLDIAAGSVAPVSPADLNIWEACWSGNHAIAAVASPGSSEENWYRARLVRFAPEGGSVQVLYEPKDQLGWLSGSPDGKQLAVVEAVCSDRGICAGDLRLIDVQRGTTRRIDTAAIDVTCTAWRDSTRLLIAGIRDFQSVVADVATGDGHMTERWRSETLMPGLFYPQAVPCAHDAAVMIAGGFDQPSAVLRIESERLTQLHTFGHAGTEAVRKRMRPVTPYRWKAPDGKEIHGWLMRGAGDRPAPLVMEVHGGPIWRWGPMFLSRSPHHVLLADRGYALFWPNPRGSTGRGQEFARAVVGDMGGADTQDYLAGLDRLVADGVADPKRVGVMGGSYGGFMTSWLITQDQRFAAAVPVAPVTNWVSQHLSSNIPYFDTFCLGSEFADPAGNHHRRSPIVHAHRAHTPTLNICGALDRCTPPGQAREFHSALREHGVESVLVTYPQEGHGVRTFPAMIDYAARVVAWFETYLGRSGA